MAVWTRVEEKKILGIAICHYDEPDKKHRLSLNVGDLVIICKETQHWYYGYLKSDNARPSEKGIFPKTYIQILENVRVKNDYVVKRSEIVEEITRVLREWRDLLNHFYLSNHESFQPICHKMRDLTRLRSQILSGNLPADEMKETKLLATAVIDTGNKLLGLDMVVRNEDGNVLDINSTATTQLFERHMNASDRIRRASTSLSKNRNSRNMNKHAHNLLVQIHLFVCKYQEECDLLVALYDGTEMKAITESYVVKWGRQGLARDLEHFDNNRVLFTDLSSSDLNRKSVFLVCFAIRVGAMDIKDHDSKRSSVSNSVLTALPGKRNSQSSLNSVGVETLLRRPFGVAAIDLTPILKKPEDFKNNVDLPFILCDKDNFDGTLRKLATNLSNMGKMDSKLAVSVELLHGDAKQVRDEYPHLVHGNVPLARKMGFPEVIFPGDVRNDLYLTLVSGEFVKGATKSSDKNIEVTVTVCNERGELLPNVISMGAGVPPLYEYKSVIYYHDDRPKWMETLKVQVPIEEFKNCHLKFMFKHRSSNESKDRNEKPFGLAYVRLMQANGTTLKHEHHQLIVYKIDQKKYDAETAANYLTLPSRSVELVANEKPSATGFVYCVKDHFIIDTNLCSTKLTQDVVLLGLLNWSSNPGDLEESLHAMMDVKSEEVVKFLQDILDALFNILVLNTDPDKFDLLVFKCLVRLIEIVSEIKYQHFQSVLDLYINESFSATLAYEKLLNVIQVHIRNGINGGPKHPADQTPEEKEIETCLFKTTKNLPYIMKFIIRSRTLFANLNGDKDRTFFEQSLDDLLRSFKLLVASQNYLLKSQGSILKNLHLVAVDLLEIYDAAKLCCYILEIIRNVPLGRLTQSKMTCIKDLVDSKLFRMPQCREILLPEFCREIKEKLESKEEGNFNSELWQQEKTLSKAARVLGEAKANLHTRETPVKTQATECVNIMNNMLALLFRDDVGPCENDIKDIMMILLRTVVQTASQMDRDNPLVGNLVAIMLGIFRAMKDIHYTIYVEHFQTKYDLLDFLVEILHAFKELVSQPVFPFDWMDMIMHQNTVILGSLKYFANIIMDKFFHPFETTIWSTFFYCSIAFLVQPSLQLDQFTMNKKSTILERYKDIREETVNEIRRMWSNMGEHKMKFVPSLVGSVLEMSLIPETNLRRKTIPIFFDMMQAEYYSSKFMAESFGDTKRNTHHQKGNFHDFEKEMIEKLDIMVEGGRGDMEYVELFHEIMIEFCLQHNTLKTDGVNFVNMFRKLLSRLLEYRYIINDESKENRMACTVSLLQFYSEVHRKEMYIKYVNKLCDLHLEFENYAEAGFTLRLHSNLLLWDDTTLSPLLKSQGFGLGDCKTHRQLKEKLYQKILALFDRGKMWECALDMCKELAKQYEYEVYDYAKLSETHQKMAELYHKILNEMRHDCEYFRVAFYGNRFPEFLRNKTFIYRGKEYERLSDFCTRILTQHPNAELMQTLTIPGLEITQADGQFIQINSVEPIINDEYRHFCEKNVAKPIVKYYLKNNVQKFKFSRPYRDGDKSSESVANLWLERTVLRTVEPLPGILRWFVVETTETSRISPIQYAIETMETTNNKLKDLVVAHKSDETLSVNELGMKINGIVDPAVMGGFKKYEEAFLTADYERDHPMDTYLAAQLKDLIAHQIPILELAVQVHRHKTSSSLMPFHERLEKCFYEMQANVEASYGKRTIDLKLDKEPFVTMRRNGAVPQQPSVDSNRHSETSMGSNDSGLSKSTQSRPQTSSIKSTFAFNFNTNLRSSIATTTGTIRRNKDKTPTKRRNSKKLDRESVHSTGSQWYMPTVTSPAVSEKDLSVISGMMPSTPTQTAANTSPNVVELKEELTTQRPLRSEVEKERRLSKTTAMMRGETVSISDDSNRNSIITTDSTTSEEEPPPLPAKTSRDSTDYSHLPSESIYARHTSGRLSNKPLPPTPAGSNYEYVEAKGGYMDICDDRKRPPTPPPKPNRNSKCP